LTKINGFVPDDKARSQQRTSCAKAPPLLPWIDMSN
jgi:hypothetical protein